jgi:hypothetical protein
MVRWRMGDRAGAIEAARAAAARAGPEERELIERHVKMYSGAGAGL